MVFFLLKKLNKNVGAQQFDQKTIPARTIFTHNRKPAGSFFFFFSLMVLLIIDYCHCHSWLWYRPTRMDQSPESVNPSRTAPKPTFDMIRSADQSPPKSCCIQVQLHVLGMFMGRCRCNFGWDPNMKLKGFFLKIKKISRLQCDFGYAISLPV